MPAPAATTTRLPIRHPAGANNQIDGGVPVTPLYLRLAVPAIELIACVLILRRMSWRAHPALIAYLLTEFLTRLAVLPDYNLVATITLVRIVVRTAVVFEVLAFARVQIPAHVRGPAVGLAIAASAILAGCTPDLTLRQQSVLFSQYYHLLLCAALGIIAVRRWLAPMLECRRHRVYRVGMAAWMAVVAGAGCFVRGGIGYVLLPYTRETWRMADYVTYVALIAVVGCMSIAMYLALPRARAVALDRRRKKRTNVVAMPMRRAS